MMVTLELLFNLTDINLSIFSKKEKFLFVSYLLTHIYRELFKEFNSYQVCLQINKQDLFMENFMVEAHFLIYLIKDILSTKEYSLDGIANYARISEDIIYDLFAGLNKNPSSYLWNKIIELHSTVRRDLYQELIARFLLNNKNTQPFL